MIEFRSSEATVVTSQKSPRTLLFASMGAKASVSAGDGSSSGPCAPRRAEGVEIECSVPVSSSVSCVGSVLVERRVASGLRSVASASGSAHPDPVSVLRSTLKKARRAAVAQVFERMRQRLGGHPASSAVASTSVMSVLTSPIVRASPVPASSVAFVACVASVGSSGCVGSSSVESARPMSRIPVALRHCPVASAVSSKSSVACQSVASVESSS